MVSVGMSGNQIRNSDCEIPTLLVRWTTTSLGDFSNKAGVGTANLEDSGRSSSKHTPEHDLSSLPSSSCIQAVMLVFTVLIA